MSRFINCDELTVLSEKIDLLVELLEVPENSLRIIEERNKKRAELDRIIQEVANFIPMENNKPLGPLRIRAIRMYKKLKSLRKWI